MIILSHRGYWKTPPEKNQPLALARSFTMGFGTETDLRDANGRLVVSHDTPRDSDNDGRGPLPAEVLWGLYAGIRQGLTAEGRPAPRLPLALNIKSDGLQAPLKAQLETYGIDDYFVFDMAVPDALVSHRAGLRVFTRHSEIEPHPAFYEQSQGVWMDMFFSEWITPDDVARHLDTGREVCLVSPELHRRDHRGFWDRLAGHDVAAHPKLMLCSDLPQEAAAAFGGRMS